MRTTLSSLVFVAALVARSAGQTPATPTAPAEKLALDVFTADSSAFGVTSTLIYGPTEALLVDAQFRIGDAERLAERITATGRRLKAIFITHPHPDHYFGLAALRKHFPRTPVYMTAAGLEEFRGTVATKIATWVLMYGPDVPTDVPTPLPLPTRRFTVDGEAVEVIADQQGDVIAPTNSYVWVPSLGAQIAGDLVYDHTHVWLADSDTATRAGWQSTLRRLTAQKPRTVVPGHKQSPELPNAPETVAFTMRYITDFDAARAASQNADELMAAMKQKYPDLGLEGILTFAAKAAFPMAATP